MNIDTLILSGGGIKCLSFLGSLKYLIDHKIINLDKIKSIIGVSGGIIYITPLLLGYSIDEIIQIFLSTNQKNILNYDQFSIQNLINNYGIFENDFIEFYCKTFEKYKNLKEINLKDLYDLSKINLIGKVINLTKNRIEYINYQSNPNLKLSVLIQMTTCIPIVFKPILYNGDYYVDGGLCGNLPKEFNNSKNYLGLNIINSGNNEINNIYDYLMSIKGLIGKNYFNKNNKKIIHLDINIHYLDIDLSMNQKKKIIKEGYSQTKKHLKNLKHNF